MDTLEKLRKLAIDQTHPGPACKPGEHWEAEGHPCTKVPASEKAKDKPEKHTASRPMTLDDAIAKFENIEDGVAVYVLPPGTGIWEHKYRVVMRDTDAEMNVGLIRGFPDKNQALAAARKDIGYGGKQVF